MGRKFICNGGMVGSYILGHKPKKPTRLQELLATMNTNQALAQWKLETFGPSGRSSQETDEPLPPAVFSID